MLPSISNEWCVNEVSHTQKKIKKFTLFCAVEAQPCLPVIDFAVR